MFKTVAKSDYKQYPAFRLYPFRHKLDKRYPFYPNVGKMPWAAVTVVEMDKVKELIFVAAATGRDPERYRQPKTWHEERASVGVVVGGIKEQTVALWERVKESLEAAGAKFEDIIYRRRFVVRRGDWWDYMETEHKWWQEHSPDLAENLRPGVGLKGGLELDLPDMLIQVDTIAVTGKK